MWFKRFFKNRKRNYSLREMEGVYALGVSMGMLFYESQIEKITHEDVEKQFQWYLSELDKVKVNTK